MSLYFDLKNLVHLDLGLVGWARERERVLCVYVCVCVCVCVYVLVLRHTISICYGL